MLLSCHCWIPRRGEARGGAPRSQGARLMRRNTTRLTSILARGDATLAPGAANALFARVIEDVGFDLAYVSGAGIANMQLGVPDIGLTTLTEIADTVAAISDVVALPLLVDADTGFGNALNMRRTVRSLERAGAAGIQIEDQVFPKKCGHFSGKAVISLGEMVQRIRAAVDARHDQDLQIVARTDARAIEGLDAAIARAHAFIEAGADATFVEAPLEEAELARIARELPAPQLANMVFGGVTPHIRQDKLAQMGFSLVLYANASLQAALRASQDVLSALKRDGSLHAVADKLADFGARQRVVAKQTYDALEKRYAVPPADTLRKGDRG